MKVYARKQFESEQRTDEDGLPTESEVRERFAALADAGPPPWLTPEGLAAMAALVEQGVPEINGPANLRLPPVDED